MVATLKKKKKKNLETIKAQNNSTLSKNLKKKKY